MPRNSGDKNTSFYHWEFSILNPTKLSEKIWTKSYLTLQEMADDMKETFSISQLESYARGYRKPSHIIDIHRVQDRVLSFDSVNRSGDSRSLYKYMTLLIY